MPRQTNNNNNPPLNPEDFEIREEGTDDDTTVELQTRRKSAGRPAVKANTARPTENGSGAPKVLIPGLGGVTLVIH